MCYTKIFKDKKDEFIEIIVENNSIKAISDGNEIGRFYYEFKEGDDYYIPDSYELYNMNIVNDYQKRGIGTEMIKFGEKIFKNVIYPSPYEIDKDLNHLSSEGLSLLQSCANKGIIRDIFKEHDDEDY